MTSPLLLEDLNIKLFIEQSNEINRDMPILPELEGISDAALIFREEISEHSYQSIKKIYVFLKNNKIWKEYQFSNFSLDMDSPRIKFELNEISRSLFKKDLYLSAKKN